MQEEFISGLDALIEKGIKVRETYTRNRSPNHFGPLYVNAELFSEWRTQCAHFLVSNLSPTHTYTEGFLEGTDATAEYNSAVRGIGVLRAARDDASSGRLKPIAGDGIQIPAPALLIEALCDRFQLVARQLRLRHSERATLTVADEYDVQDLLRALLTVHFDDIRVEEWAPSYAGKATRMDFLLKREQIVIETKKSRPSMTAGELGSQLIEDIARYERHPDCKLLICFVYDPDGFIGNPRGVEADLTRAEPYPVRVLIRPT